MKNHFSGYVLAGGKSSRMGADKAFLEIGGETFASRAVNALKPICSQVKIVLNKAQKTSVEIFPADVPHIFDIYEDRGALGGVHTALKNCATKYAIILATDLPMMTVEAIEKLAEIALASNKFIAVVPRQSDGRLQPLCAVYHARYCLPPLEKLLNENEFASACDFLEAVFPRFVDEEKLTDGESKDIFFNANFPADYKSLKNCVHFDSLTAKIRQ